MCNCEEKKNYEKNVQKLFQMIAEKGVQYCLLRLKAYETMKKAKAQNIQTTCCLGTVMDLLGIKRSQVYRLTASGRLEQKCRSRWYLESVLDELRRREAAGGI
jgi:hypothetical protein